MATWLIKQWYAKQTPLLILQLLGYFYLALILLRKALYRLHIFNTKRLNVPVIVVGNISVGGTGKTPLVIYLAQALAARGFHPGVISRGYARTSRQTMQVDKSMAVSQVGDEPFMMQAHLNCPIWVGVDRVKTAQQLLNAAPQVDVILSDDGLQHYALARDIEIMVFDAERGIGNGYVLPAGPLREPVSRLAQADIAVINGIAKQDWPWLKQLTQVNMQLQFGRLTPVNPSSAQQQTKTLNALQGIKLHAVAGIGNPERFFNALRAQGLNIQPHQFDDHHHYRIEDFAGMLDAPIIMTEKDAVKCRDFPLTQAWYLPVTASLDAELIEYLVRRLQILRGQHG